MNAPVHIDATGGIQHREDGLDRWTVTVDGIETYTVERDGSGFIAWIGHRDVHWCFNHALKACAEHARFHRSLYEDAVRQNAKAQALLAALSPEQRASRIERLELERDGLEYADAHVDVVGRKAAIERQIEALRAA